MICENKCSEEGIIAWLLSQEHWDVSELEMYLIEQYDVVFQSAQSYYELLNKARSYAVNSARCY